jgi:hypothetical protein
MTAAEIRKWILRSRSAQGLPARPTPPEIARIVAVVGPATPKNGKRVAS